MTGYKDGNWSIECVDDETGWLGLRDAWNALLREAEISSIFLTWEWLNTWWRHRTRGEELMILAARDADGRLVGIAPWMRVRHAFGPLRLRSIGFIGTGFAYPAHMDIIARAEDRAVVTAAFLRYLDRRPHEWDLLELQCLSQSSLLLPSTTGVRGRWLERDGLAAPYIALPDSWEAFEQSGLSGSRRQQVRSRRRRLLRDFPEQVRYTRVTSAEELERGLDALAELSGRRWSEKGSRSSFDRSSFESFFREVASVLLDCGNLRFHLLSVNDEVIAAHCSFLYGDVVYGYQTSFSVDWGKYRPGQVMQAHVVEEAIKEGAREFDLLQGANEYKFFWTDRTRTERHRVLSRSLAGHIWALGMSAYDVARRIGKQRLPSPVQKRIERWMDGSPAPAPEPGPA